jgi:hypothetical protein
LEAEEQRQDVEEKCAHTNIFAGRALLVVSWPAGTVTGFLVPEATVVLFSVQLCYLRNNPYELTMQELF